MGEISAFISENRWIFWPVLGAVFTVVTQVRKMGWNTIRRGNHPIQVFLAMALYGAVVGLIIAWATKLVFH
jgi:hypothetical protein